MAKTRWCVRCLGGGSVTCDVCTGFGYWYPAPLRGDLDTASTMCSACNGSGEVTCPVCRGGGRVEV